MNSVMLDTSFCIRLLKSDDEYHRTGLAEVRELVFRPPGTDDD